MMNPAPSKAANADSRKHGSFFAYFWRFLVVGILLFTAACSDDYSDESNPADDDQAPPAAEVLPEDDAEANSTSGGAAQSGDLPAWTVILYEDADDETLEEDMYYDLNEADWLVQRTTSRLFLSSTAMTAGSTATAIGHLPNAFMSRRMTTCTA
jgi:hypothetical protein